MRNYDFDTMISRLKIAKKDANITNEELSQISGVPLGTVNRVLAKQAKEAQISTICRLSDALKANLHYIIYGVEENTGGNPLNIAETTLIKKFRVLDERGKETVEGVLDMEYQRLAKSVTLQNNSNAETVRMFRAAQSEDNAEGGYTDISHADLKKLKDAKPATEI